MKKLILSFLLISFSLPVYASLLGFGKLSNHGPYVGVQSGYVDTNNGEVGDLWADLVLPVISDAGYRIFGGWRFNDNFAVEGGYSQIADKSSSGGILKENKKAKIYGYDLVGKAIVPLALGFSGYIKAGGQYVHQDIKNTAQNGSTITYQSNTGKVLPIVGIGAGYNIGKMVNIDLSYNYTIGSGEIKSIEFIAVGLSVTF